MLSLQHEARIRVGLGDQAPHWGARCGQCDRRWRPHEMASRCLKETITGLLWLGVVSDGGHQGTCPHVFVEGWSIEKAFGKATSTDKLEVEMFPHMAEGRVRVLIDDSTIRAKGKLPVPPLDVERLPH